MADNLEENFLLDDAYKLRDDDRGDGEGLDTCSEPKSDSAKKRKIKKRPNITELLKLRRSEFEKPSYFVHEMKNMLVKFIRENVSSVERTSLHISKADVELEEQISRMLIKRNNQTTKLSFEEQFRIKLEAKLMASIGNSGSPTGNASPYVIVLCASAMRCIQIQRCLESAISSIQSKKVRWTHAFAKHNKLSEQAKLIRGSKHPIQLVFATPGRFLQLIQPDINAIQLHSLRYVVVDYTNRDIKQKRLVDIAELRNELLKLIVFNLLPLTQRQSKLKIFLI